MQKRKGQNGLLKNQVLSVRTSAVRALYAMKLVMSKSGECESVKGGAIIGHAVNSCTCGRHLHTCNIW